MLLGVFFVTVKGCNNAVWHRAWPGCWSVCKQVCSLKQYRSNGSEPGDNPDNCGSLHQQNSCIVVDAVIVVDAA